MLKIFLQFMMAVIVFFSSETSSAFFNWQTTTSVGVYRDYKKTAHTPLYHSWSVKGLLSNGLEMDVDFYANNDFSENQWHIQPTQALLSFPIFSVYDRRQNILSEVKMGRMLFTEGFDLGLFDGAEILLRWSRDGGIMPFAGYLRPTDFSFTDLHNTPLAGAVLWESFAGFHFRMGATGRENDLAQKNAFLALQTEFEDLPLRPQLLIKNEWAGANMSFNQAAYDLRLAFSENTEFTVNYTNLEPHPVSSLDYANFVYKLFAVTPTETVRSALSWNSSSELSFNLSGEAASYNSGTQMETSSKGELGIDWQISPAESLSPIFSYLTSYGGEVTDAGLRYVLQTGPYSRWSAEYNVANIKKINQLNGVAQNFRGGYETHFWDRAKFGLTVEVERNQYYIFDARAQVYVTNYL